MIEPGITLRDVKLNPKTLSFVSFHFKHYLVLRHVFYTYLPNKVSVDFRKDLESYLCTCLLS